MEHFVCRGNCKGVADHQKKCEDPSCENFGKDLELCVCQDGKHGVPVAGSSAEGVIEK